MFDSIVSTVCRCGLPAAACALLLFVGAGLSLGDLQAPPPALAAECEGEECQSPAPPPVDPTPGTAVVQGPPNPPVRFPEARKNKKESKHHKRQGKAGKKSKMRSAKNGARR